MVVHLSITILFSSILMSQTKEQPSATEIVATYVAQEITLNASHTAPDWENARPVVFCSDWQGKNPDPGRETMVRVLWTRRTLYLRFECRYRELYLFADAEPNGRRDHLWD